MELIENLLHNKRLIKYFAMALAIVSLELVSFQLIYISLGNYYIATVLSFMLSVVLNWIIGRLLIFGVSNHHPFLEFLMVLVASVVGLLIQLLVVFIGSQLLYFYPLVSKVLSILFSFFWNYWFRARIVYKD